MVLLLPSLLLLLVLPLVIGPLRALDELRAAVGVAVGDMVRGRGRLPIEGGEVVGAAAQVLGAQGRVQHHAHVWLIGGGMEGGRGGCVSVFGGIDGRVDGRTFP